MNAARKQKAISNEMAFFDVRVQLKLGVAIAASCPSCGHRSHGWLKWMS